MFIYRFLDIFFVVFHSSLILFNLFGWIWKKTRTLNLIILLLTAGSWGILGIFYGFGYCPLTDWHFNVLTKLGQTGLPSSYIKYLIERISPLEPGQLLVDQATLWGLVTALIISLLLNGRDFLRSRKH